MLQVSQKLRERIKLSSVPAYKHALRAGCHPSTLSKLLHGAEPVRANDPRVVAVGCQLGLAPEECFSDESELEIEVA